jgi:hypothetical protein
LNAVPPSGARDGLADGDDQVSPCRLIAKRSPASWSFYERRRSRSISQRGHSSKCSNAASARPIGRGRAADRALVSLAPNEPMRRTIRAACSWTFNALTRRWASYMGPLLSNLIMPKALASRLNDLQGARCARGGYTEPAQSSAVEAIVANRSSTDSRVLRPARPDRRPRKGIRCTIFFALRKARLRLSA